MEVSGPRRCETRHPASISSLAVDEHLRQLRGSLAATAPAPADMTPYLAKVRERAYTITDRDVGDLKNAGFTEDEIFEQTVAAAIGEGMRRLDAALDVIA